MCFYIAVLFIIFFPLEYSQWVSYSQLLRGLYSWTSFVHSESTVLEQLKFGPGPALGHIWSMGSYYSYYKASEQFCLKWLGQGFPINCQKYWKNICQLIWKLTGLCQKSQTLCRQHCVHDWLGCQSGSLSGGTSWQSCLQLELEGRDKTHKSASLHGQASVPHLLCAAVHLVNPALAADQEV